jgi:hypothetical protein
VRVIVTGQSGLAKEDFLRKILRLANKKDEKNTDCDSDVRLDRRILQTAQIDSAVDLEHEMCKDHKFESPNYLDMGEASLLQRKNQTINKLVSRSENKEVCLIATHLAYYRKASLYHILDWTFLAKFSPDLLITLVDNVYSVLDRIRSGKRGSDDYVRAITLKDVLWWREVETTLASILSKNLLHKATIPHFIVARRHAAQVVYQLMFESRFAKGRTQKKLAYASFPVTLAKKDESVGRETAKFRKMLKRNFIVFDPMRIEEKRLVDAWEDWTKNISHDPERVVFSDDEKSYRFHPSEIAQASTDINGQIVSRDERLVEQSDFIVAYRPGDSPGAQYELEWAKQTGRVKRFVIDPSKTKQSPFISPLADRVFYSIDEFAKAIPSLD